MTVFNWSITSLDCYSKEGDHNDVVFCVHWNCSGSDGDYSGSVYSTCSIALGESFVPYAELTKDQVLSWIYANGVDKDATEAAVQQQIDNAKNPPVVKPPLPWA